MYPETKEQNVEKALCNAVFTVLTALRYTWTLQRPSTSF